MFRELVGLGLVGRNPVTPVRVSRNRGPSARPLTDSEERAGRHHAKRSTRDTRGPAVWALARATALSWELGAVEARDFEADQSRVWLRGSGNGRSARWGHLDQWDVDQLARHVHALHLSATDPIVYTGDRGASSMQSSSSMAVGDILKRANLTLDPLVKPASVAAWRGRDIFDRTGDLEEVRHRLGARSLDDARRIIGLPHGRCDLPPAHRRDDPT